MVAISSLASQQATATEDTSTKLLQLLNYCAIHPNATIRYHASDVILNIHSNARYLNEPEARSRAGGHFFMNSKPRNGEQHHNGAVLTLLTILRMVVAIAAEAEIGVYCIKIRRKESTFGTSCGKWVTYNLPLPCRLTTQPRTVSYA
jgi:hypothetical protein